MSLFTYDAAVIAAYPTIVGGMIAVRGAQNGATPPELADLYTREQAAVIARIGTTPLSDLPSLAAWRGTFRKFGVDPTQYRSAAEALLRRLTKKGDIPSINRLVDLGNLISIRYGLPVAMVDLRAVRGGLRACFAQGDEPFIELDRAEIIHPEAGEVVFLNTEREVIARRWCWRQSADSAARADTTDLLVTIEGHHAGAGADVRAAVTDLTDLLERFTTGRSESAVLSAERPSF